MESWRKGQHLLVAYLLVSELTVAECHDLFDWSDPKTFRRHPRAQEVCGERNYLCKICRKSIAARERHVCVPPGTVAHRAHIACVYPDKKEE